MGLQFIAFVGMSCPWNANLTQRRKQSFPLSAEVQELHGRTFQMLCIGAEGREHKWQVKKANSKENAGKHETFCFSYAAISQFSITVTLWH